MHLYTYIALDIANQKVLEADRYRLARLSHGDHAQRCSDFVTPSYALLLRAVAD